ncbi:MAG: protein kinase [Planctomycetota bacterium]
MHPDEVVLKFLDRVERDLQSSGLGSLEHYLEQFAGHEHVIREQYRRLVANDVRCSVDEPHVGRLIDGRYRVIGLLGRGGFGEVYLAEDMQLSRRVAVKLLGGAYAFSDDWRARLRREAEATNRIEADGICPVHDVGAEQGVPYLVMPWIEGRPLDRLIAATAAHGDGPVQIGEATSTLARRDTFLLLIERVARALQAAHEAGVVHRDVKPANLIVRSDGSPVLIDFGLAALTASADPLRSRSLVFGTPAYAAPERVDVAAGHGEAEDGAPPPQPQLDIWSLGVVLFEGLALRRPFPPRPGVSFDRCVREDPLPRLDRAMGRDLQAVVEKAMARRPTQRYASMADFAEDLERVRTRQRVAVRPAGWLRRGVARMRARAAVVAAMAIVLAVLVAAGAYWLRYRDRVVVARAVRSLAASMDVLVRDKQRLSRFGFALDERAAEARSLLAVVGELRDGVGASPEIDHSQARLLVAAGQLELQLSRRDRGVAHLRQARSLLPDGDDTSAPLEVRRLRILVEVLLGDSLSHVRRDREALAIYERALAMDEQLLAERPADPRCLSDVAFGYIRMGFQFGRLGDMNRQSREMARSIAMLERAEQLAQGDTERSKHTASGMLDLAQALRSAPLPGWDTPNLLERAERRLLRLAAQQPRDFEVWDMLCRASEVRLKTAGDGPWPPGEAERLVARSDQAAALEPNLLTALLHQARARIWLAQAHVAAGDAEAVRRGCEECLALVERAVQARPSRPECSRLQEVIRLLADALASTAQVPAARAVLRRAIEIAEGDLERFEHDPHVAMMLVATILHRVDAPQVDLQRGLEVLQHCMRRDPNLLDENERFSRLLADLRTRLR